MKSLNRFRQFRPAVHRLSVLAGWTAVASVLAFAGAADADWLVTQDGGKIQIEGPWEERGELLVFFTADGTLASMKKSRVNLEESLRLTRAARHRSDDVPDADPPPPREKAAFVLTDADVGHVRDRGPLEKPPTTAGASEPAASREPVEVIRWRKADLPDGTGLLITGTVRNTSQDSVARMSLDVIAYDHEGEVEATAPAQLGAGALAPGQSCTLRSELAGVWSIATIGFEFSYVPVRTDSSPAAPRSTQRAERQ